MPLALLEELILYYHHHHHHHHTVHTATVHVIGFIIRINIILPSSSSHCTHSNSACHWLYYKNTQITSTHFVVADVALHLQNSLQL
jgi:hypothetical protein